MNAELLHHVPGLDFLTLRARLFAQGDSVAAPRARQDPSGGIRSAIIQGMETLPESVEWLARQLEASGFEQSTDEAGPMASRLIVYRREPVEIRLVQDRGQWSADLIADGWREQDRILFPLFHGFAFPD